MKFNVIASGSKGNATIVNYHNTNILIDMGISLTRLKKGLALFSLTEKDIDAIIFKHDTSTNTSVQVNVIRLDD